MNHLLHQINWQQYLSVAVLAAVIYYLFVILRYYRPELQNLLSRIYGDKPGEPLQVLQYRADDVETKAPRVHDRIEERSHQEGIMETDILAGKLKACIIKATDKPFAPAVLIPQLKQILQEHQYIPATDQPAINRLIVNECEKTGTALLTDEEVDQWWER